MTAQNSAREQDRCVARRVLLTRFRMLAAVAVAAAGATGLLFGCSTVSYYAQAVGGHARMMLARVSVDDLLERPDTDERLRDRLTLTRDIRDYASNELALPDNQSYRSYASLGREHVIWNVTAVPEFSLSPRQWCYPVVGCQSYRGFFDEQRAHQLGHALEDAGYETVVRGVGAYSTLGRFADPVTDVMLRRSDFSLAEVIFHELAHQRLFIRGDTMFNESYATFVGEAGLRQWLRSRGEDAALRRWEQHRDRLQTFNDLLREARRELAALYASRLPDEEMRHHKAEILASIRVRFDQQLVPADPEIARFTSWFERPVNNARLVGVAVYWHWVPAFEALFDELDGDWKAFHAKVAEIADLPRELRTARMDTYLTVAATTTAAASRPTPP